MTVGRRRSRSRSGLEDDDCGLRSVLREPVEVAVATVALELRPQAFALLADRLACVHGSGAPTLELNGCIGLGAQVQPPGGILLAPAVHGQSDEVRPMLDVAQDGGS